MSVSLIQAIGFIGVICFIISFQVKSNKGLFLLQMLGSLAFLVQFMFLGGITGCFGLLLTIIRNLLLMRIDTWQWVRQKKVAAVFILCGGVVTAFTWSGILSLLPFFSVVGGTIGYWTNNAQKIRLANLVCAAPCWLIYDIAIGSIGGILNESITICSILISVYRYGWKSLGENKFDKFDN